MPTEIKLTKKYPSSNKFHAGFTPNIPVESKDPLITFYISNIPELKIGSEMNITMEIMELDTFLDPDKHCEMIEGADDDLLAKFSGVIVFEEANLRYLKYVKVVGDSDFLKVPEKNTPWFRLNFYYEKGKSPEEYYIPLIPEDSLEDEGDWFEVGCVVKDESGKELGNTRKWPATITIRRDFVPCEYDNALVMTDAMYAQNASKYLYKHYSDRDKTISPSSEFSDKRLLADINYNYEKQVKESLEKLKETVDNSSNVNDIYISRLLEYHDKIAEYYRAVEIYSGISIKDESIRISQGSVVNNIKIETDSLRKDMDDFLKSDGRIPESYQEAKKKISEARERVENIDSFLDNPVVKLLAILPGGSCVTGFCKILQGKYKEGFIDIGFELLTYGGWNKFKVMAELFENFNKYKNTPMGSLKSLISFRYMKTLQGNKTGIKTLAEIAGMADPGFGAMFKTINSCTALKGVGNELADLIRSRSLIGNVVKSLRGASGIVTIEQFKRFLQINNYYSDFLLVAGFMKTVKGGADIKKNLEKALDEFDSICGHKNLVPDSDISDSTSGNLNSLLKEFSNKEWKLEEVLNEFPDTEISMRQKIEIERYYKEHPYEDYPFSYSQENLFKMLDNIVEKYKMEIPKRKESRDKNESLALSLYLIGYKEGTSLEALVDKFCDILESICYVAGYDTFDARSWFYQDSVVFYKGTGKERLLITGYGMLFGITTDRCREIIELVF